jgi:hypothetical protein
MRVSLLLSLLQLQPRQNEKLTRNLGGGAKEAFPLLWVEGQDHRGGARHVKHDLLGLFELLGLLGVLGLLGIFGL